MGQTKTTSKTRTKRKYVESHWLIFAIQGVIALLAGFYILFTPNEDIPHLVIVIGSVLISLAIIEIFNIIHRRRRQHDWGIPLVLAIFEAAVGVTLVVANSLSHEFYIAILAGYAIIRSAASIVIGFASFENMTNRFLWVVCGMVGAVIGFVLLADPGLSETTFAKIFSVFMMVLGLTGLFFGIHAHDELKQIQASKKSKK